MENEACGFVMDSAVSTDLCHALVSRIMERQAEKAGGIPWPAMHLLFFGKRPSSILIIN